MTDENENPVEKSEKSEKPICLNCDEKMPRKAKFCPNCGQRNNQGKVTIGEILGKVWFNLTHLNGKFVKMCTHLFLPGRVTLEFFRGRQKRYPHPLQFFFVVMFFFLLAVNHFAGQRYKSSDDEKNVSDALFQVNVAENEDSTKTSSFSGSDFFDLIKLHAQNLRWQKAYKNLPEKMKTPDARRLADTLFRSQFSLTSSLTDLKNDENRDSAYFWESQMDSLPLPVSIGNGSKKFAVEDLAFTETKELLDKYGITDWRERLLLNQSLKSVRDSQGFMKTLLGSTTWTILGLTAFMSLIIMLLYRKQKRFFVEHFVFLLHFHTALMLAAALTIFLQWLSGKNWLWGVFSLWAFWHLYKSMRRFYGNSRGKTILKFSIFSFIYWIGAVLLFVLGAFFSFLLF